MFVATAAITVACGGVIESGDGGSTDGDGSTKTDATNGADGATKDGSATDGTTDGANPKDASQDVVDDEYHMPPPPYGGMPPPLDDGG